MSDTTTKAPTVLVVDDEQDIADLYAFRLDDHYDVRTAYDGEAALDAVDEELDVILLDRRMPGMTGDEVLESVRETDLDVRVVMITAVDPDVDIIEMEFDDYLCKPVGKETLVKTVDQHLAISEYSATMQELFSATSKIGVLRAELSDEELDASAEYQELKDRVSKLRTQQQELIDELDDLEAAYRAIDRTP